MTDQQTDAGRSDGGIWGQVVDRTTAVDVLVLLSVPTVLLAAMALPRPVRESLVFAYARPTPTTAVTAPFVHLDRGHLALNLAGYAVVAPTAYLLSVASGHRRRFHVAFVSLVVACPLLLSYLNLTIVRAGASVGFSGVLMALYGVLPIAITTYLDEEFDVGPLQKTAPLLFFTGIGLISVLTLGAVLTRPVSVPVRGVVVPVTRVLVATILELVIALGLIVTLYGLSTAEDWQRLRQNLQEAVGEREFDLVLLATGVFLAVPFATFPVDPIVAGGVLNLYTHLLGFALGFIGTFATLSVEQWLFDGRR